MKANLLIEGEVVSCAWTWRDAVREVAPWGADQAFFLDEEQREVPIRNEAGFAEAMRWAHSEGLGVLDVHFFKAKGGGRDAEQQPDAPQSSQWQEFYDQVSRKRYFFNTATLETTWEEPKENLPVVDQEEEPVEEEEEEETPVAHTEVTCAGCAFTHPGPIAGTRFQSLVLPSLSLCAACEASGKFDADFAPFAKITHPRFALDFVVSSRTETALSKQYARFLAERRRRAQHDCRHALAQTAVSGTEDYVCELCFCDVVPRNTAIGCRACDYVLCAECYSPPQAKFVCDVSLADNAPVVAGSEVTKVWRVKNPGARAWPEGTKLVNVGGNLPVKDREQAVDALAGPGESVNVSLRVPVPPQFVGQGTSYWRLATSEGAQFGHRFWLSLQVSPPRYPGLVPGVVLSSGPIALPASPLLTVAPAPRPPQEQFDLALARIAELGFPDSPEVRQILAQEQGHLDRAVNRLLLGERADLV